MPLVRVTCPSGALLPDQKRALAESLTQIVLDAEVDAVTEAGRMVTIIHFNEVEHDNWAVGGKLSAAASGGPNHFIVDLVVLEGLLEGERRSDVHRRVTAAFQDAFTTPEPMLPLRVWVLVHEVREGSWGAGGQTISALDVAALVPV